MCISLAKREESIYGLAAPTCERSNATNMARRETRQAMGLRCIHGGLRRKGYCGVIACGNRHLTRPTNYKKSKPPRSRRRAAPVPYGLAAFPTSMWVTRLAANAARRAAKAQSIAPRSGLPQGQEQA